MTHVTGENINKGDIQNDPEKAFKNIISLIFLCNILHIILISKFSELIITSHIQFLQLKMYIMIHVFFSTNKDYIRSHIIE